MGSRSVGFHTSVFASQLLSTRRKELSGIETLRKISRSLVANIATCLLQSCTILRIRFLLITLTFNSSKSECHEFCHFSRQCLFLSSACCFKYLRSPVVWLKIFLVIHLAMSFNHLPISPFLLFFQYIFTVQDLNTMARCINTNYVFRKEHSPSFYYFG